MTAGAKISGAAALEALEALAIGDRLELELAGVPLWRIPAQTMAATITADNLEAIKSDAAEHVEHGGAELRILEAGR